MVYCRYALDIKVHKEPIMAMGICPNNNKEFITGSSDAKICNIKVCLSEETWDVE